MAQRDCLSFYGCLALLICLTCITSCSAPEEESENDLGQVEQKGIRSPADIRVADELDERCIEDAQGECIVLDRARVFDTRRDVFEDESPVLGEDPQKWSNVDEPRYGFQWLRDYARNSTVAFFEAGDFIDAEDDKVRLKLFRDTPELAQFKELADSGFDLCPEERFANQLRGGVVAPSECTGTLIDRNLILTAAHCVRTEDTDEETEEPIIRPKHGSNLSSVRVAFNYLVSHEGMIAEDMRFVENEDVFGVREVLTMNLRHIDMSILELLTVDGEPIDTVAPKYQPVPVWELDSPYPRTVNPGGGLSQRLYRQGATIGTGARLPLKISLSRSFGWQTDFQFLGVNIQADMFEGNSGGGIYDVLTGTLVGLVSSEFEPSIVITCPSDPTQTTWPFCSDEPSETPSKLAPFTLYFAPAFNGFDLASGWRRCMKWIPHDITSAEAADFMTLIEQEYGVDDASFTPAQGQEGLGVSVKTVRMVACEAANNQGVPLEDAVKEATHAVFDLAAEVAGDTDNNNCNPAGDTDNPFPFCPSAPTIQDVPKDGLGNRLNPLVGDLFNTDLDDPRELLADSRLCTGTRPTSDVANWLSLRRLQLEDGREYTLPGNTEDGPDLFETDFDGGFETPDELFAIEVDKWTILYADTFAGGAQLGLANPGTNFDTVLFLMEALDDDDDDPLLLPDDWQHATVPFDDSGCAPEGGDDRPFLRQSQLTHVLEPGKKYLLGVTGFQGANGHFNLHVQAIPSPRLGLLLDPEDADGEQIIDGVTHKIFSVSGFASGKTEADCIDQNGEFEAECMYNAVEPIVCQTENSGDYAFVTVSCPEFQPHHYTFRVEGASTPLGGLYTDDPVAAVWEGQVGHPIDGYDCEDDSTLSLPIPFFDIEIPTFTAEMLGENIPLISGAGVRTFYAHQFFSNMDWENLSYTLRIPEDGVNGIWQRPEEP